MRLPAEYSTAKTALFIYCHLAISTHSQRMYFLYCSTYSLFIWAVCLKSSSHTTQSICKKNDHFFRGFSPNYAPNGSKSFKTQNMYNPIALSSGANTCDTVLDLA